jgi:hypothetical protein
MHIGADTTEPWPCQWMAGPTAANAASPNQLERLNRRGLI